MSDGGAVHKTYGPFWDVANSTIYSQAKIYHYAAGTSNAKDIWANEDKTGALAQPFVAGTDGLFAFFGDGDYKFVIKSSADVTVKTFDDVRLTKDRALEGEWDYDTSYPAAKTDNAFKLAVKHEATMLDFRELGINHGTGAGGAGPGFLPLLRYNGTSFIFSSLVTAGPIRNVIAYGAKGDGSTDDSAAIQTAADAVPNGGGSLYFPATGFDYIMTADIDVSNKPIRIFGDGIGQSVIRWKSGSDYGIDYASTAMTDVLQVDNLSLLTEVVGGGDAINADWAATASAFPNCSIFNVLIGPTQALKGTAYWTNGIKVIDARNCIINHNWITGKDADIVGMQAGIHVTNTSFRGNVNNNTIFYGDTGVLLEGTCDHCEVSSNLVNHTNVGISLNFGATEPGHNVHSNSLVDIWEKPIKLVNVVDSKIVNNNATKKSTSTTSFTGIHLFSGSRNNVITSNSISGAGAGGTNIGIRTEGDSNLIDDNYVSDQTQGVTINATADDTRVGMNHFDNNTDDYSDSGTNSKIADPFSPGVVEITAATTITLPGYGQMFHVIDDAGSPIDITTITASWEGRIITLFVPVGGTDANVVKDATGNIYLVGGAADFGLGEKDTLRLQCDGTNWHEISQATL